MTLISCLSNHINRIPQAVFLIEEKGCYTLYFMKPPFSVSGFKLFDQQEETRTKPALAGRIRLSICYFCHLSNYD